MELFDKKILEKVGKTLLKKQETIAVAESVTAGALQFALSTIPDAAQFFQGGITAFNIGQKCRQLRVEPIHALTVNCVSQKVANEMATEIANCFGSDWNLAITGYASPVPESQNKIYAYYAIMHKGKLMSKGKLTPHKADPPQVQINYANTLLQKLSRVM